MKQDAQRLDIRIVSIIAGIWILIAGLGLKQNIFSRFEGQSFDLRTQYATRYRTAPQHVKIIAIDQQSLTYLDSQGITWPWYRSIYGVALTVLKEAGARGIAMDMLFTEGRNDRPDDDREFVRAVQTSIPVVLATQLQKKGAFNNAFTPGVQEKLFVSGTGLNTTNLKTATSALLPIPDLIAASAALGNVSSLRDIDGVFRRYPPYFLLDNQPVPGLSVALMHAVHPSLFTADQLNSFLHQGTVTVKFYGPEHTFETIPFAAVFDAFIALEQGKQPRLNLDTFKDAYVFLGVTAPGLFDNLSVPVSSIFPGVEVNATVFANLLENDFVQEWNWPLNSAFACLWILLCTLTPFYYTGLSRLALLFSLTVFSYISLHTALVVLGYWSAMVWPLLCMFGAILTAFAYQYNTEGKKRRFIRSAFSHYLSQDVIDNLLVNPDALALGGERRELSIFFSDIAGFTTISEKVDPATLVTLLNEYLTQVTDIIFATQGTLDKYIGDAVMCFWNAPTPLSDHADRAVQTALEIQAALRSANGIYKEKYGLQLITRIGIHTGDAIVGNFGSNKRFDYTIVGDAVNTAARLEGLNKVFGTTLIVSDATRRQCTTGIQFRRLGAVQVAGKTEALEVFEPVQPDVDISAYEEAYELFLQGNIPDAYTRFTRLETDPVAQAYKERIEQEELLDTNAKSFSPVWVLSKK